MATQSFGRLPSLLVVILAIAAVLAIGAGLFLKAEKPRQSENAYLALKIKPQIGRAAINPGFLNGIWVYEDDTRQASVHFGNDIFELISWTKGDKYNRYFIRGGYRVEGDVLILQARKDLGTPYLANHLEVTFSPIDFTGINIHAVLLPQRMNWSIPKSQMASQPDLPFLKKPEVIWTRLPDQY